MAQPNSLDSPGLRAETNPAHLMDWGQWYRQYDVVPSLQARLRLVGAQIAATLDACPPGPLKVVSVCAGDGRDVIAALRGHPRRQEVSAVLVDNHTASVARGNAAAQAAGLGGQIRFVEADATLADSYAGAVPADVLILSGFLGHLRPGEAARLLGSLPLLCRDEGWIIWSRHLVINGGREQVPAIRERLRQTGFSEVHFETSAPDGFAVGRARFGGPSQPLVPGRVLFGFGGQDRAALLSSREADSPEPESSGRPEPAALLSSGLLPEAEESIPARFERMAALHSCRKAIGSGPWQPTYAELDAAANRLAQALLSTGGGAGDRVALLLRLDATLPAAMLAALKAARTVVVLNPTDPPARLKQVLADAEPAAIVTDSSHRALAQEIGSPALCLLSVEEHLEGPADPPPVTVGADDRAQIVYTSGSTGRPKGVMQTHRNILRNVLGLSGGMGVCPDDNLALLASPSGGQGLATTWCGLLNGATLCPFPMAERGVGALGEWVTEHRITVYVSSASVLRNFLRTLRPEERFPLVRLVRCGSEATHADDVRACRRHFAEGCVVLTTFSTSETGNLCQYLLPPDRPAGEGKLPLGAAVEGVELWLRDEAGREVEPGQVGEIVVRGHYLSPGYWRDPALTAERFSGGQSPGQPRLFRSGDLARREADGTLMFAGRGDNRVKVSGYRVDVSEVEETLARQPEVEGAAVCARPGSDGEQRLAAYLVLRRGGKANADPIRRALQQALPAYMVPSNFVFLDAFPLTPHGKIDRQALPLPTGPRAPVGRAERPREIVEKRITWIWQSVLGAAPIGRNDNFFELGGTSLHAVEVVLQIEEAFGAALPPSSLAEYSTVERLAPVVANYVVLPSASPLVPLRTETGGRPLFLVHSGQGDVTTYGLLARRLPGRPIYGLQSIGLQGEAWPKLSLRGMARRYLEEILGKDPTGPYLLAGTCMGGMVAMEMAQMLLRQGREVALLGMFDVPHPVPPWRHPDWTERLSGTFRDPVRDAARILRWAVIRAFGRGRRGRGLAAYRRFVANMNALANRHYRPQSYPGTITFFSTVEPLDDGEERRTLLHPYAREARLFTLPGHRSRLFARPAVDALARQLQACLEEADRA